ncbi:Secreted protein [Burkholderia sp. IT-111MI5]
MPFYAFSGCAAVYVCCLVDFLAASRSIAFNSNPLRQSIYLPQKTFRLSATMRNRLRDGNILSNALNILDFAIYKQCRL